MRRACDQRIGSGTVAGACDLSESPTGVRSALPTPPCSVLGTSAHDLQLEAYGEQTGMRAMAAPEAAAAEPGAQLITSTLSITRCLGNAAGKGKKSRMVS